MYNVSEMTPLKTLLHRYFAFITLVGLNVFFVLHHFSISITNSNFLKQFLSTDQVSLVYSVGALVIIATLLVAPMLARTIGMWRLMVMLIPVLQVSALMLGISDNAYQAVIFFILQVSIFFFLKYLIDLYLESITVQEDQTGSLRGLFLVISVIAITIAPLIVALFVVNDFYTPLYAASALFLAPAFLIALWPLKEIRSHAPWSGTPLKALKSLRQCHPNLVYVIGAHFILQLFFAWIAIYPPLYLHTVGGISWQTIGLIWALVHIPYITLELPLGYLADTRFGEKEMMVGGFIILALSFIALAFIPLFHFGWWVVAFFMTRVGAATLEITTESYFFKHVNQNDANFISFYRMMGPFGLLFGSLVGFLFVPFTGLQFLFAVFGAITLIGVVFADKLVDTR